MKAVMYVYYFVHLGGEPQMWAYRLETNEHWLRRLASEALLDVHGRPGDDDLMEMGKSHPIGRGFSLPLSWTVPGLFQGLQGDLSVQPLDDGMTQMSIRGSYRSDPSGDEHVGTNHRKVETVVKRFLDSISPDS